jgi:hypothetical protein
MILGRESEAQRDFEKYIELNPAAKRDLQLRIELTKRLRRGNK